MALEKKRPQLMDRASQVGCGCMFLPVLNLSTFLRLSPFGAGENSRQWTCVSASKPGAGKRGRAGGGGRRGRGRPRRGSNTGSAGRPALSMNLPPGIDPMHAVRKQVEYYFCDDNIKGDEYLKRNMDMDGFCKLEIIASFARVRTFAAQAKKAEDPRSLEEVISEAVQASEYLELVDMMGSKLVRRRDAYSAKDIGGGVTLVASKSKQALSEKEVPGAPCKYFFAGYCDRGARCPNTHNMAYCDAIEKQWMNPIGSGASSRTFPHAERLKAVARRLGLNNPSLSYISRMVKSKLPKEDIVSIASKQSFDYFVVIDLEGQYEIIEFPAIIFSTRTLKEVGRFHRWVKPVKLWQGKKLNKEADSVPFSQVLKEFDGYLRDLGLLGQSATERVSFAIVCCGDWDLKTQIPKQCKLNGVSVPKYMKQWVNIKDVFNAAYVSKTKATGMKGMLRRMGLMGDDGSVEGVHHLGMHDTENITRILLRLIEEAADVHITGSS